MVVIVANNLPDSVRGVLKCWFLEPKPNVFVSNINRNIEQRVLDFLRPYMSERSGLIVIRSNDLSSQGFEIGMHSSPLRSLTVASGNSIICQRPQVSQGTQRGPAS